MAKYASKVVAQAQAWVGKKEADGTHKRIIDLYNSHKPLARGYAVKYSDAWCATFVSAVAVKLGYTDIIPTECSCQQMIELFKKLGCWVENDAYTPKAGDVIFYDWDDSGKGDNQGYSDHVGYVEKVSGTTITIIEGNFCNAVERRTLNVNGKYIRGYGVPKYETEPKATTSTKVQQTKAKKKCSTTKEMKLSFPVISKGCSGAAVSMLQTMIGTPVTGTWDDADVATWKKHQKNTGQDVDGICGKDGWTSVSEHLKANTFK